MIKQTTKHNIAIICFTRNGCRTALRIRALLGKGTVWSRMSAPPPEGALPVEDTLTDWTRERFADSDLIVFVGAAGIAVRSIAPYLVSKRSDPAVLCVDEKGSFVISLVSGHIGGANEAAALMAEGLGAIPVITTATDLNGKFAVDVFAEKNGLHISSMTLAKYVSAAVLEGRRIPLSCEGIVDGEVPRELIPAWKERLEEKEDEGRPEGQLSIHIGIRKGEDRPGVLRLVPGAVTVGLGCRRGKDPREMLAFARDTLARTGIAPEAVEQISTIDVKEDEPAMQETARALGAPLVTWSADELRACPGSFSHSEFVEKTVGVDNVCERSAVLGALAAARRAEAAGGEERTEAHLLAGKRAGDGMTAALAVRKWRVSFA